MSRALCRIVAREDAKAPRGGARGAAAFERLTHTDTKTRRWSAGSQRRATPSCLRVNPCSRSGFAVGATPLGVFASSRESILQERLRRGAACRRRVLDPGDVVRLEVVV